MVVLMCLDAEAAEEDANGEEFWKLIEIHYNYEGAMVRELSRKIEKNTLQPTIYEKPTCYMNPRANEVRSR